MRKNRSRLITVVGRTNKDYDLKRDVKVSLHRWGLELASPSGQRLQIATVTEPSPGSKLNALDGVAVKDLDEFFYFPRPAGGALNLAEAVVQSTRHWPSRPWVRLVDTNQERAFIQGFCDGLGIELITLPRHECQRNLVVPCQGDKIIVRTGKVSIAASVPSEMAGRAQAACRNSEILVMASPKDSALATICWQASPGATRYLGATGSVPWDTTSAMAKDSDALVCNFAELLGFANSMKIRQPYIGEDSPHAAAVTVAALFGLRRRGHVSSGVAAVTHGRNGSVIIDSKARRAWKIGIQLRYGCRCAATRSNSGDRWLGQWILGRESSRDGGEPSRSLEAAIFASRSVGEFLGLRRQDFEVDVRELRVEDTRLRPVEDSERPADTGVALVRTAPTQIPNTTSGLIL